MQDILKKIDKKHRAFRIFEMVIGIFIMAVAFNLFILPNDIVSGGVSGLSLVMKRLFNINVSVFVFIGSMLLLVLSFFTLGYEKTRNSILGSILFPVFLSLTSKVGDILPIDTTDQLLLVLFGGVIYGFGMGLVFKAGFTTGGTDILNQIVCKYFKTSLGTSMILVDGLVVLLGGLVFGWTKFMYALMLDAKGGYTNIKNPVLFAVIPTNEYYRFKEGIRIIDPKAFFTVVDAYEVMGGE